MIDFHSHILPDMDDGASSVEESLALLSSLREQGVTTVVATPHYKCNSSIDKFLHKRERSYEKLKEAMEQSDEEYPDIVLGAEVAICERLLKHNKLERLSMGGTDYILAEMPDKYWEPYLYHVLYALTAKYKMKIIIAHVDRYFSSIGRNSKILKLVEMQPVFQVSTPALMYRKGRKLMKWLMMFGVDIVFGTDCHNITNRAPYISKPFKYIAQKYGNNFLDDIEELGNNILNNI